MYDFSSRKFHKYHLKLISTVGIVFHFQKSSSRTLQHSSISRQLLPEQIVYQCFDVRLSSPQTHSC